MWKNSQNSHAATPFPSIRCLYESPKTEKCFELTYLPLGLHDLNLNLHLDRNINSRLIVHFRFSNKRNKIVI